MPSASGYTARLPQDTILDTGLLSTEIAAVDTVVGVSRGGLRFDPGIALREIDYDGKRAPIVGGDRISFRRPVISGTMLQVGPEDLRIYEPAAAGALDVVTPKPAGTPFVIGEYLKNLKLKYKKSDGQTVTVTFPYAICTKYDIHGTDNNEGEVAVAFEARLDRADVANSDTTVPYTIVIS